MNSTIHVRDFAQITDAKVDFGDLTVLVGPQGSGKSLLLQLLKLALDRSEIEQALTDAGHSTDSWDEFLDVYFGQGMGGAWNESTTVEWAGRQIGHQSRRSPRRPPRLFYIPAHRAMLLADGWPAPFLKLNAETPTIARLFSQALFSLFGNPKESALIPIEKRLKDPYSRAIDEAIYHGGRVELGREELRKRLELHFGTTRLPFMTWTAGQREFTPLLLGLYHLLPPRKQTKQPDVDWIVIEEPEMGLHPRGVSVVMLLVLDLLWRGYRVVVSTHSPLVLDIVFAIQSLKEAKGDPELLCDAFEIDRGKPMRPVMQAALEKRYRTYSMQFQADGGVIARDISGLDPDSELDEESGWGGLTQWSSNFNEIISRAINAGS